VDDYPSPAVVPQYPDLEGKVAIVTGAGAVDDGIGNGRAVAITLADLGARVVAVDLDPQRAETTAAMIQARGGTALAVGADVSSQAGCATVVEAALSAWGTVHLLENNVGIVSRGSVVEESPDAWERLMRVNINSVFHMSRAVIPYMEAQGGGAIVNISSLSALRPRGLTAYSTSKGAVIAMTRAMAVDHAPAGIRVNCVAPGPVYTPMVAAITTPEQREARAKASPMGIEGNGWDVANAVCYLLSDASRFTTGQTLVVDGGVSLSAAAR
jgi:NAD(P)-dependent dehydrogenase (short-subunit alcohol dehydrogenase family)